MYLPASRAIDYCRPACCCSANCFDPKISAHRYGYLMSGIHVIEISIDTCIGMSMCVCVHAHNQCAGSMLEDEPPMIQTLARAHMPRTWQEGGGTTVYAHVYTHTVSGHMLRTYLRTYLCRCPCTCPSHICVCEHARAQVYAGVCALYVHIRAHAYAHVYALVCTHVSIRMSTRMPTHMSYT